MVILMGWQKYIFWFTLLYRKKKVTWQFTIDKELYESIIYANCVVLFNYNSYATVVPNK